MNDSREPDEWLDADVADRLLSGRDVPESDRRITELARLLAVAGDLPAGRPEHESAALAAFRQERDHPSRRGLRHITGRTRPAKVVIGGVAAVFALGGVAIAAQNGVLPRPFHPHAAGSGAATSGPAHSSSPRSGAPSPGSSSHGTVPGTGMSPAPAVGPRPSSPGPVTGTGGPPAVPGVKGLCESYGKAAQQGKALAAASRARLEQAAGGKGKVDAYCAQVTGAGSGPGTGSGAGSGTATATASATVPAHGKPPTSHPTPHASRRK